MVGRAEGPTQSTQCQWPRRCNSSCPLPTICHPEPLQALAGRFGKCQFLPWCNPVFSKVESLHVTTTIFAISTRDQALLFLPYDLVNLLIFLTGKNLQFYVVMTSVKLERLATLIHRKFIQQKQKFCKILSKDYCYQMP